MVIKVRGHRKTKRKIPLRKKHKVIEVPDVEERSTSTYMIDKIVSVYEEQKNSVHLAHDKLFNVCKAHLPMDASMTYLIVDRCGLVPNVGSHVLAVRELPFRHRKAVMEKAVTYGWVESKKDTSVVRMHEAESSIDVNKFFKRVDDWKGLVNLWMTENLKKDQRLLDSFKSTVIPLIGNPIEWQKYNSHAVWLTNTSTGKSEFNEIAGNTASVDLSIAGLFGANVEDYAKQQIGGLEGYGMFLIDEIEQLSKYQYSSAVMLSLLTYLEQGRVERRLKIPIKCSGTKAVIFASNPSKSGDMLYSLVQFLKILQPDADTTRLGKRLAHVIVGDDFDRVKIDKPISALRSIMPRILHYCMLKWYDRNIVKIFKTNMQWINDTNDQYKDISNEFLSKSVLCPNEKISNFIKGMAINLSRVRMSALRCAILDNLDKFHSRAGYRFANRFIIEEAQHQFLQLVSHNFRSVDNLIVATENLEPTKECAQKIKDQFPDLSSRHIGLMLGVSYKTIQRWLSK